MGEGSLLTLWHESFIGTIRGGGQGVFKVAGHRQENRLAFGPAPAETRENRCSVVQ